MRYNKYIIYDILESRDFICIKAMKYVGYENLVTS